MPRPVQCDLCGRDFFPGSIAIHRQQCEEKQKYIPTACRYCDAEVRKCDLPQHLKRCEAAKSAPKPRAKITRRTSFSGGADEGNGASGGDDPNDHRVPCAVCGRKFVSDRLAKHQSICRRVNAGKGTGVTPSSGEAPTATRKVRISSNVSMAPRNKNEVTCEICGRQFFKTSIEIHRKQCIAKQPFLHTACPYCDGEVQTRDLEQHIRKCEKAPPPSVRRAARREAAETTLGLGGAGAGGPTHLVPCAVCGRTFARDRLAKHQGICRRISKNGATDAPPVVSAPTRSTYAEPIRNPNEVDCDLCGRPFFKTSIAIHRKQCLEKQPFIQTACPHCDCEVMQKDLERHIKFCEKAPPPSERPSHRVAAEAALGLHKDNANGVSSSPQPTATDGHLVPCSICGRTFVSDRLAKHQSICRKNDAKAKARASGIK
eukprot:m.93113 g.93113  ORF g.93113 m.93113 type:complete len:430 (-) comp20274_c0_seq3:1354-2643(-)